MAGQSVHLPESVCLSHFKVHGGIFLAIQVAMKMMMMMVAEEPADEAEVDAGELLFLVSIEIMSIAFKQEIHFNLFGLFNLKGDNFLLYMRLDMWATHKKFDI